MNRVEQLAKEFQHAPPIFLISGVGVIDEELHVADQMGQAELQEMAAKLTRNPEDHQDQFEIRERLPGM